MIYLPLPNLKKAGSFCLRAQPRGVPGAIKVLTQQGGNTGPPAGAQLALEEGAGAVVMRLLHRRNRGK